MKIATPLFLLCCALSVLLAVISISFANAAGDNENNAEGSDSDKKKQAATVAAVAAIPRKRSIFQACYKDIDALCVVTKEGEKKLDVSTRRHRLREAATCLEEKESEIKDDTCKSWVKSRGVCFADAAKEGVCDSDEKYKQKLAQKTKDVDVARVKRMAVMFCLRTLDSSKFSDECTSTDFYKSIVGLRRFHNSLKKDSDKKKQAKLKVAAEQVANI